MKDPALDGWHGKCSLGHTRVYAKGARIGHLLCDWHSPNNEASQAICGKRTPEAAPLWFGTGCQAELDRAKVLPLCLACHKAVR